MLRVVLLLLVLANLLFFVWTQGLLGKLDEGREPQRLNKQIVPEMLKVTVIDPSTSPAESCRSVTGLASSEMQRLAALAEEKLPGLRVAVKSSGAQSSAYWVYIPPQPGRLAAERKQIELKNRGVTDSSVILEEGADQFALSLGVFDNDQSANAYLQELMKRGVKSARIQKRENLFDKTQLEVRGAEEALTKQLPELLSTQFAASALSIGDCAAGR